MIVPQYRALIPGFSDVMLLAEAAAVGNPCISTLSQVYDDEDVIVTGPHVVAIRIHLNPPDPSAPSAYIGRAYDDRGNLREGLRIADPRGVEMIPISTATRLIDAWQRAINTGTIRHREPHVWPREEYVTVWREVRPQHRSRPAIVHAMATRTGMDERTIRRWPKAYGYPLFETVEEYDARIDKF